MAVSISSWLYQVATSNFMLKTIACLKLHCFTLPYFHFHFAVHFLVVWIFQIQNILSYVVISVECSRLTEFRKSH